jgi:hypothetical protein
MSDCTPATPSRATLRSLVTPARVYAVTRIALGAWLLVAPMAFGGKWFAAPQDPLLTGANLRSVGGRDLGIGVGLLLADRHRPWLWLCAFCDVLDAGMVLLASGKFSERDTMAGVVGALSYALVAIAIALFGTRSQR